MVEKKQRCKIFVLFLDITVSSRHDGQRFTTEPNRKRNSVCRTQNSARRFREYFNPARPKSDADGIPTRVRKTPVRTTPVRSQQCECQQCERVNSANANSANATAVRMSAVRMRQQCERRFSELCKTYRSLFFFFCCKNFCYFLPQWQKRQLLKGV